MHCPGSVGLGETQPEEPDSVHAAEGTFAHDLAAECLEQGVGAVHVLGRKSPCGRFVIGEDDVEHLDSYLSAVRLAGVFDHQTTILAERRVKLAGLRDDIAGTTDAVVAQPNLRRVDIFDLKYGSGVFVPAAGNPQLRIYALGALLSIPGLRGVERVGLHIVQPRHFGGGETWRSDDMTAAELLAWGHNVLKPAADAVDAPNPELTPGDWCRWCPAKAVCPALRSQSLEHARSVFDDVETLKPAQTPPDPAALSPAEVGKLLSAFPVIEAWISAVHKHAYAEANRGRCPPGWKLVKKKAHRKWRDTSEAKKALLDAGLTNPYSTAKLLSPAQAEKALGRMRKGIVAKLAETPDAGTTLVPDSDKRAAVEIASPFDIVRE